MYILVDYTPEECLDDKNLNTHMPILFYFCFSLSSVFGLSVPNFFNLDTILIKWKNPLVAMQPIEYPIVLKITLVDKTGKVGGKF